MKKILVTGSHGLLGQKITSLILSSGRASLIATSKGQNRYPEKQGYTYIEMDLSNENDIARVFRSVNPDVVINTAAITNVDICEIEREQCRLINTDAVKTLALLCCETGAHLIHLSTDFVFDGKEGPYREDAQPNPLSFYGRSKADTEDYLKSSSCRWTIIRTILVYGITGDMSRSNFVLWAKSSLEKNKNISVVNDQWRMPTLAEDLAEACLRVAERGVTGILHISGGDMKSIHELVLEVADYWKLDQTLIQPVSSETLNQSAVRPERTGFILDRARQELNYHPRSFREGLKLLDLQMQSVKKM